MKRKKILGKYNLRAPEKITKSELISIICELRIQNQELLERLNKIKNYSYVKFIEFKNNG